MQQINDEKKEEEERSNVSLMIACSKRNKFDCCDIYTLYNEIQFSKSRNITVNWYRQGKEFIDIRPKEEFVNHKIYQFKNIPFDIIHETKDENENDTKLLKIIENIASFHYQKKIRIIYIVSNEDVTKNNHDIKFCKYLEKILFNIYNEIIPIIILNIDFNRFCKAFPFLCYTKNEDNRFKTTYPNHILNDELFVGNIGHATNKNIIQNLKITHIINMTMKQNVFENNKDLNIKYFKVPIEDEDDEEIEKYFQIGIDFIYNALKENKNGRIKYRVLVHCEEGISRSSSMIIAYLIKIYKMTFIEALQYIQIKREIAEPNNGFIKKLKLFQQQISF